MIGKRSEQTSTVRRWIPVWLPLLPFVLIAIACDQPTPLKEAAPDSGNGRSARSKAKPAAPPDISVQVSDVKVSWKDGQQVFKLAMTNHGQQPVVVHALVYATNESIEPPRRAISPPTGFEWFTLANSQDGKLTAQDVERSWKASGFLSARGQRLKKVWDAKIGPEATEVIDCAHDLEDVSKHPVCKGQKLKQAGYTEYHVWLFTADGRCFLEGTVPAVGAAPELRTPKAPSSTEHDTKAAPSVEAKPVDPKAEAAAAQQLKLANYYLVRKRVVHAKEQLQLIVQKYPDTEAGKTAQQLLHELDAS